jgi:ribonuclease J
MIRFIALSGTTGVTQNHYIYEYLPDGKVVSDAIIVDCGVGFPEPEMFGVDLVIPDFKYTRQLKDKIRGILITHGHEDHLGALPFLLKDVKVPVYSTKLVAGFIEDKFADYEQKIKVNVFNPESDVVSLGVFKVTPFRISHSVPDSVGFVIDTPDGTMVHCADYKFDWTPVDGRPFDIAKLAMLTSGRVIALASDSLGATTPGYTGSEKEIEEKVERIVKEVKGQVFFTTISSNITRMQQAINVAERLERKVCFIGRSIDSKAKISKNLGYLHYREGVVVNPREASKLRKDRILYIISGSYGQPGSALYRLIMKEHDFLTLEPGDVVIFSSDPAPPGSKANVDFLVDNLIESDIDVHYYDMQEDLHVSGHGSQEDIKMLMSLVRAKYLIPIGGTIRHMRAYNQLAQGLGYGVGETFELLGGESVNFDKNGARRGIKLEVKDVLVDGLGIGDVGNVVLRDRKVLSKEGIAIAIIQFDDASKRIVGSPEIISRGFVFGGKQKGFLSEAGRALGDFLKSKRKLNKHFVRDESIGFLERYFFKEIGRRPMVLPVIVEV